MQAIDDVVAERNRQRDVEGWTESGDDKYTGEELAKAAASYCLANFYPVPGYPPQWWPWDLGWWKPTSYRRNLVKAAALIVAEIERLDRIKP